MNLQKNLDLKKFNVRFLNSADKDLFNVTSYLSRCNNLEFASFFYSEIDEKMIDLERWPYMYQAISHEGQIRRFVLRKYIFIYQVDNKKESVLISRVYHQHENYQNMFV